MRDEELLLANLMIANLKLSQQLLNIMVKPEREGVKEWNEYVDKLSNEVKKLNDRKVGR